MRRLEPTCQDGPPSLRLCARAGRRTRAAPHGGFRDFALSGRLIDLTIGLAVEAAFATVVVPRSATLHR